MLDEKERLLGFITTMKNEKIFHFSIEDFESRLKLQKYVFLATKFGLDFSYAYNLYIHGPYSPSLAEDYYHLEGIEADLDRELPRAFIELVRDKDKRWLELASTLILFKSKNGDIEDEALFEMVLNSKPSSNKNELERILEALRNSGIKS